MQFQRCLYHVALARVDFDVVAPGQELGIRIYVFDQREHVLRCMRNQCAAADSTHDRSVPMPRPGSGQVRQQADGLQKHEQNTDGRYYARKETPQSINIARTAQFIGR